MSEFKKRILKKDDVEWVHFGEESGSTLNGAGFQICSKRGHLFAGNFRNGVKNGPGFSVRGNWVDACGNYVNGHLEGPGMGEFPEPEDADRNYPGITWYKNGKANGVTIIPENTGTYIYFYENGVMQNKSITIFQAWGEENKQHIYLKKGILGRDIECKDYIYPKSLFVRKDMNPKFFSNYQSVDHYSTKSITHAGISAECHFAIEHRPSDYDRSFVEIKNMMHCRMADGTEIMGDIDESCNPEGFVMKHCKNKDWDFGTEYAKVPYNYYSPRDYQGKQKGHLILHPDGSGEYVFYYQDYNRPDENIYILSECRILIYKDYTLIVNTREGYGLQVYPSGDAYYVRADGSYHLTRLKHYSLSSMTETDVTPAPVKKPEPVKATPVAKPAEVKKPAPVKAIPVAKPAEVKKPEPVKAAPVAKPAEVKKPEPVKAAPVAKPAEVKKPEPVKAVPVSKPAEVKKPEPVKASPKKAETSFLRKAEKDKTIRIMEMKNGKENGFGLITYKGGDTIEISEWENGVRDGFGIQQNEFELETLYCQNGKNMDSWITHYEEDMISLIHYKEDDPDGLNVEIEESGDVFFTLVNEGEDTGKFIHFCNKDKKLFFRKNSKPEKDTGITLPHVAVEFESYIMDRPSDIAEFCHLDLAEGEYSGTVKNSRACGFGKLVLEGGDELFSEFENNHPSGMGIYVQKKTGTRLIGHFEGVTPDGFVSCQRKQSDSLIFGTCHKGVMDGFEIIAGKDSVSFGSRRKGAWADTFLVIDKNLTISLQKTENGKTKIIREYKFPESF